MITQAQGVYISPCPPKRDSKQERVSAHAPNLKPIMHNNVREEVWIIKPKWCHMLKEILQSLTQ